MKQKTKRLKAALYPIKRIVGKQKVIRYIK